MSVFNRVSGINESIILIKQISCECKCKFDGTKCKSNQLWNNNKSWCECKKHHICEKDYVWNPSTCNWENGKNLASIMDNSTIICDDVIESYDKEKKLFQQILIKRKQSVKHKVSVFYLLFCLSL